MEERDYIRSHARLYTQHSHLILFMLLCVTKYFNFTNKEMLLLTNTVRLANGLILILFFTL